MLGEVRWRGVGCCGIRLEDTIDVACLAQGQVVKVERGRKSPVGIRAGIASCRLPRRAVWLFVFAFVVVAAALLGGLPQSIVHADEWIPQLSVLGQASFEVESVRAIATNSSTESVSARRWGSMPRLSSAARAPGMPLRL